MSPTRLLALGAVKIFQPVVAAPGLTPLAQAFAIPVLLSGILLPIRRPPAGSTPCRGSTRSATWWTRPRGLRGDFGSSALLVGPLVTVALSAWWGTRTFAREDA